MDELRTCRCGQKLALRPEMYGRNGKCPNCLAAFRITEDGRIEPRPDSGGAGAPAPPPPPRAYERASAAAGPPPAPMPAPPPPPSIPAPPAPGMPAPQTKKCPFCGESILLAAQKCKHCGEFLSGWGRPGSATPPSAPGAPAATNGLAVASFVLGMLGCTGIAAILAVVCGHIAVGQIRTNRNSQSGEGLAFAGLILGYLFLGLYALFACSSLASNH